MVEKIKPNKRFVSFTIAHSDRRRVAAPIAHVSR